MWQLSDEELFAQNCWLQEVLHLQRSEFLGETVDLFLIDFVATAICAYVGKLNYKLQVENTFYNNNTNADNS